LITKPPRLCPINTIVWSTSSCHPFLQNVGTKHTLGQMIYPDASSNFCHNWIFFPTGVTGDHQILNSCMRTMTIDGILQTIHPRQSCDLKWLSILTI
jgi:hypothetical protein